MVRGLERRFGDVVALAGIDFDVSRGELFGVVGPDGAGKTTSLRVLAGVLSPTAGSVSMLGIDVLRRPEAVKHHIAYVAQRFGLYEDLTVRENIDFYADLFRVPSAERPERRARLYEFSRLGPFEHRLVGQLSGGMKQKAALCCALIHRPDVLLLDEPTFGIDPISRRDLWLILHEMVAQGVTVIVTTSYLDEAERCDRVALLHQGRILALDAPAALQAAHTGALFAVPTGGDRAVRDRLRVQPFIRRAHLFGEELHLTLRDDSVAARAAVARMLGVDVAAVRPITASLEDVFLQLTDEAGGVR